MKKPTLLLCVLFALACAGGEDRGDARDGAPAGGPGANVDAPVEPPRSDPEPSPGLDPGMEMVPDPGGAPTGRAGPAFDCAEAEGAVEELLCTDAELAALDRRLDAVWREALRVMDEGDMPEPDRAGIRAEQRGWIAGRNDCWRSNDVRDCVLWMYRMRIPRLEADFGLAPSGEPTFWTCRGNPADEFVLTFFETDPPSVRVERGDGQEVMVSVSDASGARYTGTFGKEVRVRGDSGVFVWPQTDTLSCVLRSRGGG